MSSSIGGKKREVVSDFSKKVGLGVVKVIAVNPTVEEYVSVLGFPEKEDASEISYTGTSRDGNNYVRLDFWTQTKKPNSKGEHDKFKVTFFLEDKVRLNKEETKTQFINNIGVCSWGESPADLPDWFTKREFREAKSGEEEFYGFLRTWLAQIDYRDATSELEIDWKRLIKGDVRDLRSQVKGEWAVPFILLATVITKEVDGEIKEYQSVYNKAFLPEYSLKHFRVLNYQDEKIIEEIEGKKFKDRKTHEKFVLNVVGDYGCKDFYKLKELADYDSSENVVTSESTKTSGGVASADY